jgi:hypothetical protein
MFSLSLCAVMYVSSFQHYFCWRLSLFLVDAVVSISSVEAHIVIYVILRRIRGYCTIVYALTRAFQ